MQIRAIFFVLAACLCALAGPPANSLAGRWSASSPDPIGRTEHIELVFIATDAGFTGVLHTPDGEIKLAHIHLQGPTLTFDASRELRGRSVLYHYEGTLSGDTLDFTVQNEDGSALFRFTAHRAD